MKGRKKHAARLHGLIKIFMLILVLLTASVFGEALIRKDDAVLIDKIEEGAHHVKDKTEELVPVTEGHLTKKNAVVLSGGFGVLIFVLLGATADSSKDYKEWKKNKPKSEKPKRTKKEKVKKTKKTKVEKVKKSKVEETVPTTTTPVVNRRRRRPIPATVEPIKELTKKEKKVKEKTERLEKKNTEKEAKRKARLVEKNKKNDIVEESAPVVVNRRRRR